MKLYRKGKGPSYGPWHPLRRWTRSSTCPTTPSRYGRSAGRGGLGEGGLQLSVVQALLRTSTVPLTSCAALVFYSDRRLPSV